MLCSTCGKPLPAGAAFCPTCGSLTPDQVSSSGVSPSDSTSVYTSYGDPSQNPYPYENPYPYATPAPYAAPPTAPPPPPVRRRRPSARLIALLIVLVLLIITAGGILYFKAASPAGQAHSHASPTAPAQQVTATPSTTVQATATATPPAQTPQSLYEQVTQGSAVLDDPLLRNDTNNWTESTSADGQTSCVFSGGAYHAKVQSKNAYALCMAQAKNFSDLAYQVQMSIVKGEFGGIVFRADGSQSKYYSFFIDRSGNYTLITSVDNTGTHDNVLRQGTSALIRTDLNQVNTLAVIARGSNIYLYINQQYIASANDSS